MKRLVALLVVIAVVFVAVPALMAQEPVPTAAVQNVKTITWSEFWQGLEFIRQTNGQWEFVHEGRPLHDYTVVAVPPNTLSVRQLYIMTSNADHTLYLVLLEPRLTLKIAGSVVGATRDASAHALFACKLATDLMCRQALNALLLQFVKMQSLGVANKDYEHGNLPEQLIFSFLLNSSGRFNR